MNKQERIDRKIQISVSCFITLLDEFLYNHYIIYKDKGDIK